VGNNGAEHARDVAGGEGNAELLRLGALILWLGDNGGIQQLNGALEARELHHGVRNLASPERGEALEKASVAILLHKTGKAVGEANAVGGSGLNSNLDSLHWGEGNVGNKLGAGGAGEEEEGPVSVSCVGAGQISELLLEELVEAELAGALGSVAKHGGEPSTDEAGHALLPEDGAKGGWDGAVLTGVSLHVALNDVERGDEGVREATAGDAAGGGDGVELRRVHHDRLLKDGGSEQPAPGGPALMEGPPQLGVLLITSARRARLPCLPRGTFALQRRRPFAARVQIPRNQRVAVSRTHCSAPLLTCGISFRPALRAPSG